MQHVPENMVVTAEAGMTLAALQTELAKHRQWLPLDPPHSGKLTLAELINTNSSGPRRFAFGTVRDHLIGIKVALADGTIISSGGKVVKNVAGYDLAKLFIGGHGSLGTTVETTFKLRPLPEQEQFIEAFCSSLEQADQLIEAVFKSEITPIVLDLHNLEAKNAASETNAPKSSVASASLPLSPRERAGVRADVKTNSTYSLVLAFAGTREEVEWQMVRANELGFRQPTSLDYETKFWNDNASTHRLSILPSKLAEAIRGLNGAPFIARAGNGVIYHHGNATPRRDELPLDLMRRLKDAFDPRHILPELPL